MCVMWVIALLPDLLGQVERAHRRVGVRAQQHAQLPRPREAAAEHHEEKQQHERACAPQEARLVRRRAAACAHAPEGVGACA